MNKIDVPNRDLYYAEKAIRSLHIEKGDISQYVCDAIVCPDNKSLGGTGAVAKAIHLAAGPMLKNAVKSVGDCAVGDVKATAGYQLKATRILHTVSPTWNGGIDHEEMQLAKCYDAIMLYAAENECEKIAIPSIGTGYHKFPKKRAAEIAIHTIMYHLLKDLSLDVTIVCSSEDTLEIYRNVLKKEIVDQFLSFYSPEAFVYNQLTYRDVDAYTSWMIKLRNLEAVEFCYSEYMDVIKTGVDASGKLSFDQVCYLYAERCENWDYRTCLAYITYIQRKNHWSGYEGADYHYEQCRLGSVRKVLLRMKELLSQNELSTHG